MLVQARRLPRREDLTVPLQHQLLLQVDHQDVAVLPLLVRQVVQNGPCGLSRTRVKPLHRTQLSAPCLQLELTCSN